MRVFVTGATGHIGSAVVRELLGAGHEVVGLARSERAVEALVGAGAGVHRGSLDDPGSLAEGAKGADGVVHLAFKHDFSDYAGAVATELRAVDAMGAALEGSGKPFVVTSGTLTVEGASPRGEAEERAVAFAGRGVRASVVRLPPSVHSEADRQGFVPMLIGIARNKGLSAHVGDGANRWPAVHTLDAARLFRLALEGAPAGARLNGVGDEGVAFREIAEVIGRRLDVPVGRVSVEEAEGHFGFLAAMVGADNPTSGAHTRELLGWRPEHAGLVADLEAGHYFGSRADGG
ncbi:SDR family oxidoreductase [Streptomyces sp. NPDC057877]|uniref:SDR family oxidoreductase n=1 Tax=Streptomyces sp. NPDC057877 TaxID=3346269 RepID=UPI0036B730B0